MMSPADPRGILSHPLLDACGVDHSFGLRDAPLPDPLVRPKQVHGDSVARLGGDGKLDLREADAVVTTVPGARVAVLTADCVPILACSEGGEAVAAIHAGWRGLAAGVVARGVEALAAAAPTGARVVAAVGPHIGACCYEVDAPVLEGLEVRFGGALRDALRPSRPGHEWLDLGALVLLDLERAGVAAVDIGVVSDPCTSCDPRRFHSYRREGPRAGRLVHFIAAKLPHKP